MPCRNVYKSQIQTPRCGWIKKFLSHSLYQFKHKSMFTFIIHGFCDTVSLQKRTDEQYCPRLFPAVGYSLQANNDPGKWLFFIKIGSTLSCQCPFNYQSELLSLSFPLPSNRACLSTVLYICIWSPPHGAIHEQDMMYTRPGIL